MGHARIALSASILLWALSSSAEPAPADDATRVTRLADEYVAAYVRRYPESTVLSGMEAPGFERLFDTVDGRPLKGPNDIVFDRDGGFWFTDLGKVREGEVDRGGLYHARPGGAPVTVAYPAMTPNGIGLSPDDRTLYYA